MLIKIAVLLLLAVIVWRWALGSWPWDGALGRPSDKDRLARARDLLGVDRRAGREEILAAHRKLIGRVHPDRGGSPEQVHAANEARDLLLKRLPGGGPPSGQTRDDGADRNERDP